MHVHEFVDEGRGHSSYVIDLGDGTAAVVDPPRSPTEHEALTARKVGARVFAGGPATWTAATGQALDVGR